MSALDAPASGFLSDHIRGAPAGRPYLRKDPHSKTRICDGCGKNKPCVSYEIANLGYPLDLCLHCRRWYLMGEEK